VTSYLLGEASGSGALWGTESEDLNATVVSWPSGGGVDAHVNDLVDVVMVVLRGSGRVIVDSAEVGLEVGQVVLVPKSASREIRAGTGGVTYVNVHRRKPKLMPDMVRPR
jgi:mannose-6-phosphate isomerase-like protein (cupin superfamily)